MRLLSVRTFCAVAVIAFGLAEGAFLDDLLDDVRPILTEDEDHKCLLALEDLVKDFGAGKSWAVHMVDANAKIPAGILYGNLIELGNFDECLAVIRPQESQETLFIKGKYCLNSFSPTQSIPETESLKRLPNIPEDRSGDLIDSSGVPIIVLGSCLPHDCSSNKVLNITAKVFERFNVTLNPKSGHCQIDEPVELRAIDYTAMRSNFILGNCRDNNERKRVYYVLFGAIFLLVIGSTAYDVAKLRLGARGNTKILFFSAYSNGRKLFSCPSYKSPEVIHCLNGIRALSIIWVVFGHTYFSVLVAPQVNKIRLLDWIKEPFSSVVFSALLAVDSFFFLSGTLVAWMMFKELNRGRKINILLLYLHRYIRLTPALAAGVLFASSLMRYFGSGPFWWLNQQIFEDICEKKWWSALLYLQNYLNPNETCFGHSWYLSVDFQLFILSPLIIFPLWRWRHRFLPVILGLILLSIGLTIYIVIDHQYRVSTTINTLSGASDYDKYLYTPTHTRMGPWLIGVAFGYFLYQTRGRLILVSRWKLAIGWVLSLGIIFGAVFGVYPYEQLDYDEPYYVDALYIAFAKIFWALALCWIVWACYSGYGGVINWFLSLTIWEILGKLAYSIYLVHFPIQVMRLASTKNAGYFSDVDAIHQLWGDFGFAITVAFVWILVFEMPFVSMSQISVRKNQQVLKQEVEPMPGGTQEVSLATNENGDSQKSVNLV